MNQYHWSNLLGKVSLFLPSVVYNFWGLDTELSVSLTIFKRRYIVNISPAIGPGCALIRVGLINACAR